jgi:phosphatidylserine/phosphatidylglycerophosphate/cardiolipin synthase-like enzyme
MSLCGNTIRCMNTLAGIIVRCAVTAAVAAGGAGCTANALSAPPVRPGPAAGGYRLIQEPDDGYQFVVELINGAARSVRMTMYELADRDVVDALIGAHQRQVSVKVILDAAFHGRTTNQEAYRRLRDGGVDVIWAPEDVIYHQKTVSVDDTTAAVSTANLVSRYYRTSRDAVILTTDRADTAAITATFDADFASGATDTPPLGTPGPHLIWSPDGKAAFLQHINSATTSLDLTTDPALSRPVSQVAASGCSVHLLARDSADLYMHEKTLLTDNTSLILGSHNLSPKSLEDNRELSLQLDTTTAPDVLAAVHATFEHDYQQAAPAPTSSR